MENYIKIFETTNQMIFIPCIYVLSLLLKTDVPMINVIQF